MYSRKVPTLSATSLTEILEPLREYAIFKDKFKELHNGAFGPLYIAREGFPKWGDPVDQSKPVENVQYFYKDSNGEYQKAAPFNTFDPSIDYYVPSLLYEKAVDWVEGV